MASFSPSTLENRVFKKHRFQIAPLWRAFSNGSVLGVEGWDDSCIRSKNGLVWTGPYYDALFTYLQRIKIHQIDVSFSCVCYCYSRGDPLTTLIMLWRISLSITGTEALTSIMAPVVNSCACPPADNEKISQWDQLNSCRYLKIFFLVSYLGFLDDLYSKQLILQRINNDHHMSKVSVDDTMSVIPIVFWPHYVNLVITNMTNLKQDRLHPCYSGTFKHYDTVCAPWKMNPKFSSLSLVIRVFHP